MKKILFAFAAAMLAAVTYAGPHGHDGRHGGHRGHRAPVVVYHGHHSGHHRHHHDNHHGSIAIGAAIAFNGLMHALTPRDTIVVRETPVVYPAPVQVATPAPVINYQCQPAPVVVAAQPQRVWVPGHYEWQSAGGAMVQIWVPGRYEIR